MLRCELNANMPDFIGNYYYIQRRVTMPQPSRKGKEKQMVKEVKLDEKSTCLVDIEVVQHGMVMFYGILEKVNIIISFNIGPTCRLPHILANKILFVSIIKLCGDPLKLVLKLDEVEIMSYKSLSM